MLRSTRDLGDHAPRFE